MRIREHRRCLREGRLDLLERVHEVAADQPGLHGANRAERRQDDRRHGDVTQSNRLAHPLHSTG
jgi:hypothetical protein